MPSTVSYSHHHNEIHFFAALTVQSPSNFFFNPSEVIFKVGKPSSSFKNYSIVQPNEELVVEWESVRNSIVKRNNSTWTYKYNL